MSERELYLLARRRFLPLFVTQFFGAFNDNLFKNALVILITYQLADKVAMNSQLLVTMAAGIFILPFFLFSATAGQCAERFEKSGQIQYIKILEIVLALLATAGFLLETPVFLLIVLFLLGTQSTLFGPLKYSILPDHLSEDELIAGNGLIQMGTFTAILLGTIIGGLLILMPFGKELVSGLLLTLAITGWLASRSIPRSEAAAPELSINPNFIAETYKIIRHAAGRSEIALPMMAISWFWLVGATYLAQYSNLAKSVLGADEKVATLILTAFTVGIATGSILCNRLVKGKITARFVPLGALGMSLFGIDLFLAINSAAPWTDGFMNTMQFLGSLPHLRILMDLTLIAICGGVYIVPLYSLIQNRSQPEHRSRNIAALNIVNALFMVLSAVATAILLKTGFDVPQVFLVLAVSNAIVAIYLHRKVRNNAFQKNVT